MTEDSVLTRCGEPVASPDEEWRWRSTLGTNCPCANCTEIIARRNDVEWARV